MLKSECAGRQSIVGDAAEKADLRTHGHVGEGGEEGQRAGERTVAHDDGEARL